ncbi:MAG: hypothetical protein KGJ78_09090 [Alphaproteobacteria bacterium]|nr:hypothetical protein [Alphaproteobacteria bacterium]
MIPQEEKEERYRVPLGELAPIISAAVFGIAFFVAFLWVALGSPFDKIVANEERARQSQPAAVTGEVNVSLPDKH